MENWINDEQDRKSHQPRRIGVVQPSHALAGCTSHGAHARRLATGVRDILESLASWQQPPCGCCGREIAAEDGPEMVVLIYGNGSEVPRMGCHWRYAPSV